MTDREAKRRVGQAIQETQENPELVKALIDQLEQSGQIAKGDLDHLVRICDKWLKIAADNRKKGSQ